MNKEEFIIAVKELGIELDETKLNKLNKFYELLIEWNEKINLTRIVEKEGQKRSILEVVGERITFISSSTNKKDENTLDEKIEEEV